MSILLEAAFLVLAESRYVCTPADVAWKPVEVGPPFPRLKIGRGVAGEGLKRLLVT